jgi:ADP-heptose:LPS heptosyltransferase
MAMDVSATNILLCLRYGIGDLIMELPVLERLREALPHATITGLGAEPAIQILDRAHGLDAVLSLQQWGVRHLSDSVDEEARRRLREWLMSSQFDLILDPSHTADAVKQIVCQQDVPVRDADSVYLGTALALGLNGLAAVKHATYLGWSLNVPPSSYPAVHLQSHEREWARGFLEERDLQKGLMAVSPGASADLKRWPIEHFVQVCRYSVEKLDAAVLVLGGPEESKLFHTFRELTQSLRRIEIVQDLHLRQVAALLAQCGLYVGNDSGLMHVAAAVGTPVVALFGPTDPHLYLPAWVRSRAVASAVACPYRPRTAFGHPRCVLAGSCLVGTPCIQAIDPTQVCSILAEERAKDR